MSRTPAYSVNLDPKSPFYFVSFVGPDGKLKRRSTKVPARGGIYQGERLSAAQAKRRAVMVAAEIARAAHEEYEAQNNMTVRELFRLMIDGKLGRVSASTYENAVTTYKQFCTWLGGKADEPLRLITRAMMKEWAVYRRGLVRHSTARKDLSVISAAFA